MLEVPSSVGSQKLQGGGGGERMILTVVEAVPLAQRMIACAPPPVGKAALAVLIGCAMICLYSRGINRLCHDLPIQ